jgi:hypothetical protein
VVGAQYECLFRGFIRAEEVNQTPLGRRTGGGLDSGWRGVGDNLQFFE